jgi:hypothetical protein
VIMRPGRGTLPGACGEVLAWRGGRRVIAGLR